MFINNFLCAIFISDKLQKIYDKNASIISGGKIILKVRIRPLGHEVQSVRSTTSIFDLINHQPIGQINFDRFRQKYRASDKRDFGSKSS